MPESDQAIAAKFAPLYSRFYHAEIIQREKPLLVHYTSLETAESILKTHELWFSNPLFMNDWEEMRFGILEGLALLERTPHLRNAFTTDERVKKFRDAFSHFYEQLDKIELLDIYVFCLATHPSENEDGLLSMWRGYGGLGRGAALVFDTAKMNFVSGAPMFLCKVEYGTKQQRIATLEKIIEDWSRVAQNADIPDVQLPIAAHNLLLLLELYALTSKHVGFREEDEWRIIHIASLDREKRLEPRFSYTLSKQGVEPRLRFLLERHSAGNYPEQSFGDLLHKIILGPSVSSPLARMAFIRMLKSINREQYSNRVVASTIPLRPSS